jgi:hypothetical protein
MRSRWEDSRDADLDTPATISERQLRALRRQAGFGVLALMLGLVSVCGLGWTLLTGPEGLERIQGLKQRVLSGGTAGAETENTESATPAPAKSVASDSALARPLAADSARAATGAPPSNQAESQRLETQASSR